MKSAIALSFLFLFCVSFAFAQTKDVPPENRTLTIVQISEPVKIDGELTESCWQRDPAATHFTEYSPQPGAGEQASYASRAWICYDRTAIYVGALLTDTKGEILREITKRDESGNADYFSVLIDTYCDRINGYEFTVTSAGQQIDKRHSATVGNSDYKQGDETWDAVWHSAVKMTAEGWCVEMKIPFSAIRFSKEDEQVWGFNLVRYRRKTRQELYWNERKPEITDRVAQWGTAIGINHVNPPTLLSFSPYISGYAEHFPDREKPWTGGFSAGLDVKWGISRAFTLDATVIPDFGEVASDAIVHNVSPFEVEYNEKRPFFMEGTELFNKGAYFYSRRIGGQPVFHDKADDGLRENEEVIENPVESKMINAVKLSGRTRAGLGVGVLNALTAEMNAVIRDTVTGAERVVMTAPFSNYNVFVMDQSLKNNSYVSFVNTSVLRAGDAYDSDVMGLLFRFNDAQNKYYIKGQGTGSFFTDRPSGFKYNVELGKARGNWQYHLTHELMDDHIDINDMGMQHENNRVSLEGELAYKLFQPTSWYNTMTFQLDAEWNNRFLPFGYEEFQVSLEGNIMLKDYTMVELGVTYRPSAHDFYEPEKTGRFINVPAIFSSQFMFSSNYANPFYCDVRAEFERCASWDMTRYYVQLQPAIRFSPRLLVSLTGTYTRVLNDIGSIWRNEAAAFSAQDSVFMVRRNVTQVETVLNAKYAFNANMNVTLAARHYVSKLDNREFLYLEHNGDVSPTGSYFGEGLIYSLFYIDLIYTWRFAPGSELNIVWKNQISPGYCPYQERNWIRDVSDTFSYPQRNNLSIKLIYYLDSQKFSRKSK